MDILFHFFPVSVLIFDEVFMKQNVKNEMEKCVLSILLVAILVCCAQILWIFEDNLYAKHFLMICNYTFIL